MQVCVNMLINNYTIIHSRLPVFTIAIALLIPILSQVYCIQFPYFFVGVAVCPFVKSISVTVLDLYL